MLQVRNYGQTFWWVHKSVPQAHEALPEPAVSGPPEAATGVHQCLPLRPALSLQEQCFFSCHTPSASFLGSSGGGGTPPAPPTKTCSVRSGLATTGPTTPC